MLLAGVLALPAGPARPAEPTLAGPGRLAEPERAGAWPDDRFHRLAALALLEELRSALLSENSATLTLEHWCATHGLAGGQPAGAATIVAKRDPSRTLPLQPSDRARLQAGADEPVRYRHVRLTCHGHLLSEADNWYVPARLTPAMNRQLDATDTPFGRAVQALGFSRTTLSSRLLWQPLPPDWIAAAGPAPSATALQIPDALIENRAVLRRRDGVPFSLVVETYRRGLLDFAAPPGG